MQAGSQLNQFPSHSSCKLLLKLPVCEYILVSSGSCDFEQNKKNTGSRLITSSSGTSMNFFIILLTVTSCVSSSSTPGDSRSSFLHIVQDYYLDGRVSHRQKASSVLSCAQLCLRRLPLCRSLNYGNKICELNDEGIDITKTGVTSLDSLVAMSGFIFAQLFNLTVSKKLEINLIL
ncbi:hypothetical protein OS493_009220 [Desmophyllum pertusum]|uniref:Apple domain-containing protein n=1 Tax=Desmophyllum pertusum TaxID=174260 RepID=A0A9W9Z2P2_9CNID|nr:hypothetical protein OS493_009220 [Desmophyllum pertusum]